ncbi:DevR family CRISPR-associated autoregulator [Pyrobaculum neutrophilum]|uniref:CRISPR-associated autoregulator, DevR family n=1 Tax=Pyrobaculum neutrophilum (strain DSM 2338 / JCM 9278 / NBRC 100436 / V24Sta) TaxID=444157 RepID=B1YDR3_PYRNV|nr:DevR family CRISPR-associated autoregulator [Pyrobaculum neutrophilum]ACB39926.1 CRISPR-associated autoregulator, DevR family [Pyrobaculum neutrophilum V24Sta]
MFVSFAFRFRAEVEALNMVETMGNYARHRTVPVLIREDGGYRITAAPGVSGQSVSYGYMAALVKLAAGRSLPVCEECASYEKIGGFFKRADRVDIGHDERVKTCVVEDITGFMATKEAGGGEKGSVVKRTSAVMFSYMLPDTSSARGVVMPQFHVRYNLQKPDTQRPFTVESGTAVYIQAVAIDVMKIGRLEDGDDVDDWLERAELAFDALKLLYSGMLFGAKKARYLPAFEALGGVAAVADPHPFMVSPPRYGDYWALNKARVEKMKPLYSTLELSCFDREGITSCDSGLSTLEELIDWAKERVLEYFE